MLSHMSKIQNPNDRNVDRNVDFSVADSWPFSDTAETIYNTDVLGSEL